MRQLDPNSAEDRRITAFTRYWPIEIFPDGWVMLGHFSYDCWGKKQHGVKKMKMDAKSAKEHIGQHNYLTLKLMQQGCCPPQLMKGFIEQEGMPAEEKGPVEEAMKLHARGYLGGGG